MKRTVGDEAIDQRMTVMVIEKEVIDQFFPIVAVLDELVFVKVDPCTLEAVVHLNQRWEYKMEWFMHTLSCPGNHASRGPRSRREHPSTLPALLILFRRWHASGSRRRRGERRIPGSMHASQHRVLSCCLPTWVHQHT